MRRVGAGAGDGEVDPAQRKLLDVLRIVAQLAAAEHLNLVAAVRVLLDLLREHLGGPLACTLLLVGVAEFQNRLGFNIRVHMKTLHTPNTKTIPVKKSILANNDFLFIATSSSGYGQEKACLRHR